MKNLMIRACVITLALTGFAASTFVSKAAPGKVQPRPIVVGTVGSPPLCMPKDPTYCGLD